MSEAPPDDSRVGGRGVSADSGVIPFRPPAASPPTVTFNRLELSQILNVYGRMVAAGDWRVYAIDHQRDAAVFSIFRRTSEMPLYRIVKTPRLARRQGAWSVVNTGGVVLKRGHELARVLAVLDRKPRLVETL